MEQFAATHDGPCHADDVFTGAALRISNPQYKIVRTRDPKVLSGAWVRFDVGGKCNPDTGDYDHHQKSSNGGKYGAGVRPNDIPYAAFGLFWLDLGADICALRCTDEEIARGDHQAIAFEVERTLVMGIDAHDNGFPLTEPAHAERAMSLSNVISGFNPSWDEGQDFDAGYERAVAFATTVLERAIVYARGKVLARTLVTDAINANTTTGEARYFVLDRFLPWTEVACLSDMLYAVYPTAGTWRCQAVPTFPGSPGLRRALPAAWRGLNGPDLEAVTRISGSTFCHNSGFIAGATTREGAILLAELALIWKD